jgi:hypothetical protein
VRCAGEIETLIWIWIWNEKQIFVLPFSLVLPF